MRYDLDYITTQKFELEEILETFKLLETTVLTNKGNCENDDIKYFKGDVHRATLNPSIFVQYYENIEKLLEAADILMKSQFAVINKLIEKEEEAEQEFQDEEARFEEGYELTWHDDPRYNFMIH